MTRTINPGHLGPQNRMMPIWQTPPPSVGASRSAPGNRTRPISPRVTVLEHIPAVEFKRDTNGREASLLTFALEMAEYRPARADAPPIVLQHDLCMAASWVMSGGVCSPRTHEQFSIKFDVQAGLIAASGRPPGGEVRPLAAFAPKPRPQEEVESAGVLKPKLSAMSLLAAVQFDPQAGTGATIPGAHERFGELVLPPLSQFSRVSSSQSSRAFNMELGPAHSPKNANVKAPWAASIWNSGTNMDLPGSLFLGATREFSCKPKVSTEGPRIPLPGTHPVAPGVPFTLAVSTISEGAPPSFGGREPVIKVVSKVMPLPEFVLAPRPGVASRSGLLIWTAPINSYRRRKLGTPRLREGGKLIHSLPVGPATKK